jgi:hypothetical protein
MTDRDNPKNEGHTREWQDRARVVLDAKESAHTEASPNQSPVGGENNGDTEKETKRDERKKPDKDDRFY